MYYQTQTKPKLLVEWSFWLDYTHDNVQRYAPMSAGVYVLATKLKNGNVLIFYVGQAEDLDKRLKEHLSENEPNKCVRDEVKNYLCAFRYAKVSSQADRDRAERALYNRFTPKCNDPDRIPDVPGVEINF
jgi:excinuclease UvrABC nuclease subunit